MFLMCPCSSRAHGLHVPMLFFTCPCCSSHACGSCHAHVWPTKPLASHNSNNYPRPSYHHPVPMNIPCPSSPCSYHEPVPITSCLSCFHAHVISIPLAVSQYQ